MKSLLAALTLLTVTVLQPAVAVAQTTPAKKSRTQPTATQPAPALNASGVYEAAHPSVLVLRVKRNDGAEVLGSAFMAVRDGLAVTAWHVVKHAAKVTGVFANGEEFDVSGLVDKDEKRDLALVRVKVAGRPLLPLSSSTPPVGSKAFVIGAPKGLDFSISDGLVSQVRNVQGFQEVQFTCPTSPGNSGGPLIDERGRVVGVVSWQVRDGQNLNFAIPAHYVLGLDASLPTTPWAVVKVEELQAGKEVVRVDDAIRDAIGSVHDCQLVIGIINDSYLRVNGGFRRPLPPSYYECMKGLKAFLVASPSLTSDEPLRAKALSELVQIVGPLEEMLRHLKSALDIAFSNNRWSRAAEDELSRASGAAPKRGKISEWADPLTKDPAFAASSPEWFKELKGGGGEPRLDVRSWSHEGLSLVLVEENGLGARMGLISGDHITGLQGNPVSSLTDFKTKLRELEGKAVTIEVRRGADLKKLDWKVEIPK